MSGTILIAEDQELARKNMKRFLEQQGYKIEEAADGVAAIQAIDTLDFDVVIADLMMPGADGIEVLKHTKEVAPNTLVIVATAYASVDTAVEALRLGAQDYILKPIILEDLLSKVRHSIDYKSLAWEIQMLRRELNRSPRLSDAVWRSPSMREIFSLIEKVGSSESTVLITGESGVGKEVVAATIHAKSPRKDKVFLPVNCSAIPETLLESQLFGHMKGAFTGATSSQEGLFQSAHGGTIFLDEIGDLPAILQPKLLRVIETKEFLPVGSSRPVKVDVRIVAATNSDLKKASEKGQFRKDLYYRLNVINIHIPPLRERREDLAPLIEFLIRRHNLDMKKAYKGADTAAIRLLMSLPWKGNIRELDNILERAMILGNGEWITVDDLPYPKLAETTENLYPEPDDLRSVILAYEKLLDETMTHQDQALSPSSTQDSLKVRRASLRLRLQHLGVLKAEEGA